MRILFIIQDYPPQKIGGHQLRCKRTFEGLLERGHNGLVLTELLPGNSPLKEDNIWRLLRGTYSFPRNSIVKAIKSIQYNIKCYQQVLSEFKPDIIGIWALRNTSLLFLEKVVELSSVPVVHFIGGQTAFNDRLCPWYYLWQVDHKRRYPSNIIRTILAGLINPFLPTYPPYPYHLSNVCFNSRFIRDWYIANHFIIQNPVVIHGGVDLKMFQASLPRAYNSPPRILTSSRIVQEKGIEIVLKTFEKIFESVPGIQLSIIGTGHPQYFEYLKTTIHQKGLTNTIKMLGAIDPDSMPKVYLSNDVIIHHSMMDTWPNAVLEGMACGLVPIATDRGGIPELIEHGKNGILIKYGAIEDMAQQIRFLYDHPKDVQRLGYEAINSINNNYSLDHYLDQIENLFQNSSQQPCAKSVRF